MQHSTQNATPDLIARRKAVLGTHSPMFYNDPLELVSGKGVWLRAVNGRRFLDAYNNVPHVGHAHPAIANAVSQQMRKLSLNTRYVNNRVVDYAEALLATLHPDLDRVSFGNSGSEANELAIRLARFRSGNTGLIFSDYSYHGTTLTLAQATTGLATSEPMGENVRTIRIPDATGLTEQEAQQLLAEALSEVDTAIASLQEAGFGVAATLFDPLFSTEGLVKVPPGYVEGLIQRVRQAGGLYIADEVQSGFGRVGRFMWGHELFNVTPDIVTMGKPMGNGHPIGATIMGHDLLEDFGAANMFFNTFAGNPVSSAAGHAVLDVMADEGLRERATATGAFLKSELTRELAGISRFDEIRGDGLFAGMRFTDPDTGEADPTTAKQVVEEMYHQGVLISRVGRNDEVLKIRPPLAFEEQHAEILIKKLTKIIRSL
ncbi:aspartate aminotransferase family protein [Glutamicibacter sp. NPDC087344]|uniref:aspartate aminotransferase family protein n=1 Tax=Glutamicibacter sp. NPDC087344 TaxID=3363994 RepID=UPI0038274F2E